MGLNDAQRAAVEHGSGPLLVLAGAGSGKTRVITQRIARLIAAGTPASAILAVTFTNKAAGEMKERLAAACGDESANQCWISTFHSFGVRFLTEESRSVGYGDKFVIFDQSDSMGLIRDLMRQHRIGDRRLDTMAIASRLSLWKNKFLDPKDAEPTGFEYDDVAAEIYGDYEESLRSMHAFDFDDLVVAPVRLLSENERVREKWQARFQHLLVDEFQDTNKAQLELVRLLTNQDGNVCVVGDDDQSIYGWRGADVTNILDFERHFERAQVVKLEMNYRSRSQILEVANAVIKDSSHNRHDKTLRAARGTGDLVRLCVATDAEAEAKQVASEIRRIVAEENHSYGDIAVLYRSNNTAKLIEEELRTEGIPYRLFGGKQFFDRKEVKDALAYLRAALYPTDEISLRRVLNYPPRGIGKTTIERMSKFAGDSGLSFNLTVKNADAVPGLPSGARMGLANLNRALDEARASFAAGRLTEGARNLFTRVRLEPYLMDDGGTVGKRRWGNIQWLLGRLSRYEQSSAKPRLGEFVQRLSLSQDGEEEVALDEQVILATLHASKGLEFDTVFLVGCVEGQLPHSRTLDPKVTEAAPTDVEEERRLFYVGVTRARERLYLMRPERRAMRGKIEPLTPSRFLSSVPEEMTEEYVPPSDSKPTASEVAEASAAFLSELFGE